MKIANLLLGIFLFAACSHFHHSGSHHDHGKHQGHELATKDLKLNSGKKWATDTHLRKAMANIHGEVEKRVPAVHNDQLSSDAYMDVGNTISKQIDGIFDNCKLEPEADEMIHLVLSDIITGVDAMKGEEEKISPRKGFIRVINALDTYGDYFNHPKWKRFH